MTFDEIKQALLQGKTVHWTSPDYVLYEMADSLYTFHSGTRNSSPASRGGALLYSESNFFLRKEEPEARYDEPPFQDSSASMLGL